MSDDEVYRLVVVTPEPESDETWPTEGNFVSWWYWCQAKKVEDRRYRTIGGVKALRSRLRRHGIEMRIERALTKWEAVDG